MVLGGTSGDLLYAEWDDQSSSQGDLPPGTLALEAVARRVHNIEATPNGIRFNFTEWYVPRDLQRYTAG